MEKEIITNKKTYVASDIIYWTDLAEAWFTNQLKCSSDLHVCLTNWTKVLILEPFEDDVFFKINWIDDYVPPVKKTNWWNN